VAETVFKNVEEFLKSRDIIKVENFSISEKSEFEGLTEKLVKEHLNVLSEFHKTIMGFNGFMGKRLNNYTGKRVEEFKVYTKKLKRDIRKLELEGVQNNFEAILLSRGEEFINRAEKCISEIYSWQYYNLINRSMKRIEICLGNTYQDNIRKLDTIEVINIEHFGYNMVECDGVYYLNKLKRKGARFDWKQLIGEFCNTEGLGVTSEVFISAMIDYPYEFMKCCNRYRYRKKNWDDEKYAENLALAIDKDGVSIL
jgi:hypothetical protein